MKWTTVGKVYKGWVHSVPVESAQGTKGKLTYFSDVYDTV